MDKVDYFVHEYNKRNVTYCTNCGEMSSSVKGKTRAVTRLRTKVVVEGNNSALPRGLLITSLVCPCRAVVSFAVWEKWFSKNEIGVHGRK